MNAQEILDDNYKMQNGSFLFYLYYKRIFHKDALNTLCKSIFILAEESIYITQTATKINHIYGQILKCFLYHFDVNDPFVIANLPENYNHLIEQLDKCVSFYFSTRISAQLPSSGNK